MYIQRNWCECHPETCCHFNYYIYKPNGDRLVGSDNYEDLEMILKGLKGE